MSTKPRTVPAIVRRTALICPRRLSTTGNLLPLPGPITAFAFLNTLQALEDLPFEEGLLKGSQLYNCQPYLSEEDYRAKMARGRIRLEDLSVVLEQDLGDGADAPIHTLASRFDLRMAMLQFPLRQGPDEELRWFVAETDALTRLRAETTPMVRERFLEETRHWVMRDLRNKTPGRTGPSADRAAGEIAGAHRAAPILADLIQRFGARFDRALERFHLGSLCAAVAVESLPRRGAQRPVGCSARGAADSASGCPVGCHRRR